MGLRSLFGLLVLVPGAAICQPDLSIIIDRTPGAIELFFTVSADDVPVIFDYDLEGIVAPEGTVDFDPLRLGTYDLADQLFSGVTTTVADSPLVFEGMSLMVHPVEAALPWMSPIDGMIAIGVCTAPDPERSLTLADLRTYAGFIAYTDNPTSSFTLGFPETGRDTIEIEVRDHVGGRRAHDFRALVADGSSLAVPSAELRQAMAPCMLVLSAVAINLAALWLGRRIDRRRRNQPRAVSHA